MFNIKKFIQNFNVTEKNKKYYGEVHTDFILINKILDLIPKKYYKDPTLRWLDPCAGRGYFSIILYNRLFLGLKCSFPNKNERKKHIISNMLFINEINIEYIIPLKSLFGEKSNITNFDFLNFNNMKFDFIVGNPPYNSHKFKNQSNYTSIWQSFIKHSISLLTKNGFLCFITPSIWMKNTHIFFDYMLKYDIQKICTLNSIETKQIFHGEAQVPTSYFLIKNNNNHNNINIFDEITNKYVKFIPNNTSLPVYAISIVKKLQKYVKKYGCLNVSKTNIRPERIKNLILSDEKNDICKYPNIYTCKLTKQKPYLCINYSNIECPYKNQKKIVLAHKMYGFPYYDDEGLYGITGRDNFIILNKTNKEFVRLKQFLSSKLFLMLTESTRYRMAYLEINLFEFIPDITKIVDFPDVINDKTIHEFFKFNEVERKMLNSHKKIYLLNKL